MHKQLVLLHNAIAAYFSGNAAALEGTLKQFNIKVSFSHLFAYRLSTKSRSFQLKSPNTATGSWLEQ